MNLEILAPLVSLLSIIVGIPNQIYRLYKVKTAKEIPILNWVLGILSFLAWIFYAKKSNNHLWVCTNLAGFILSSVVFCQIVYYRWLIRK